MSPLCPHCGKEEVCVCAAKVHRRRRYNAIVDAVEGVEILKDSAYLQISALGRLVSEVGKVNPDLARRLTNAAADACVGEAKRIATVLREQI